MWVAASDSEATCPSPLVDVAVTFSFTRLRGISSLLSRTTTPSGTSFVIAHPVSFLLNTTFPFRNGTVTLSPLFVSAGVTFTLPFCHWEISGAAGFSSLTITVTSTSLSVWSGKRTTTVPVFTPALDVSGLAPCFHTNVGFCGKSVGLAIALAADASSLTFTTCSLGVGAYVTVFPFASELSIEPLSSFVRALTFTVEPSFTAFSFRVISPVVGFTVNGASASTVQVSPFFVTVYVTSTGFVPSCGVYVTLTRFTFVWFSCEITTSPFCFGVTTGALGFTLNVTGNAIFSGK